MSKINWLVVASLTILLGLRSAPRGNDAISTTEFIFGLTLTLQGEFVQPKNNARDKTNFVQQLRKTIQEISPLPFRNDHRFNIFIPKDLMMCSKVHRRVDRVKEPLEQPYDGPFLVKKSKKENFIDINSKSDFPFLLID